jgi:hypothetical protein
VAVAAYASVTCTMVAFLHAFFVAHSEAVAAAIIGLINGIVA